MSEKKTLLGWCEELRDLTDIPSRTILSLDQGTCEKKMEQLMRIYLHVNHRVNAIDAAVRDAKIHLPLKEQRRFCRMHNPHYCSINSPERAKSYIIEELNRIGVDVRVQDMMHLNLVLNIASVRAHAASFLRFLCDEKVMEIPRAQLYCDIKTALIENDDENESVEF